MTVGVYSTQYWNYAYSTDCHPNWPYYHSCTCNYYQKCVTTYDSYWGNDYYNVYLAQESTYITYIYKPCYLYCTSCFWSWHSQGCNTCTSNAYHTQNLALCNSRFANHASCAADNQCLFNNCPN